MGHTVNIVGQKFGRLLVLSKTNRRDACGNVIWKCRCDCGNTTYTRSSSLKNGHAKSCRCLNGEINGNRIFKNLVGETYGFLTILSFAGYNKRKKAVWWCKCECGVVKRVESNALRTGATVSCGCYQIKVVSSIKGERHYRWRGGYSYKDYPPEWNKYLKEFIRNRDNRKCQFPGCDYDDTKENKKLSVHHIDGDKKNCSHTNLISLCNKHHQKVEQNNPEAWMGMFCSYTESFMQ